MEIRELLSKLHMGHGDPDRAAGEGSGSAASGFVNNSMRLNEDEFGPLVSQESLQQEFIDREHSRLHPDVSRAALLSEPTLDSVEGELLGEYRSTLAELFGNPEELSEEDNLIDQLEAEFTGIPGDEPKPFIPMWSPVDRERLTQAFENGGIDAVNEAFPDYNGLELPEASSGMWRKHRDLIEQLIPPEQIPAMESHNRLAYLNMLRNAAGKGEGVPMHGVRSYREGMGPFMRTGENVFDAPLREGHNLSDGGANYIMGNGVPAMQEIGAGSNAPSVTGLMNFMDYFPAGFKYNSQVRGEGDSMLDAPAASLQKGFGQSYQNQSNKIMFPYNEAIGTSQAQTGSYYERYKEYEKNAKAFAESQPPGGVQQAHGSLEGILGSDYSKDLMEGPMGNAIGFGYDMASEIADFSPMGAFGEGLMNAGKTAFGLTGAGARIGLLKKAALAARSALPEVAGEGVFDGLINTGASAVNMAGYGPPPAQEVEDPGVVGQRIEKAQAHMDTLTPLPQDPTLISGIWNEEDNHLRTEMNRRRDEGFPVDSLVDQSRAGNGAYNRDLWKSAQQNRNKAVENKSPAPTTLFGF